jgi:DNA-binding transcriptional LysR family regulator
VEFHQLRYFVAAAEAGSITAAAVGEHVTQPAMSRQIALLERRLGVPLFERKRQRIHLTAAGRWFLPKARQLLCDAATSAQQLRESFGNGKRTLRLGFVGTFLDDLVAPAVRDLKKKHRGVAVALFDLAPKAQLDRLAARELDAAILANLADGDRVRFTVQRLSRHRVAAVLPAAHALAARASIALAALRDDDWVSLAESAFPGRREFLRAACAAAGFQPRVVAEVDSITSLLGAVAAGDGVALVPAHASKLPHAGCTFVRLEPAVTPVELLVLTAPGKPTDELRSLSALLVDRARRLADG